MTCSVCRGVFSLVCDNTATFVTHAGSGGHTGGEGTEEGRYSRVDYYQDDLDYIHVCLMFILLYPHNCVIVHWIEIFCSLLLSFKSVKFSIFQFLNL